MRYFQKVVSDAYYMVGSQEIKILYCYFCRFFYSNKKGDPSFEVRTATIILSITSRTIGTNFLNIVLRRKIRNRKEIFIVFVSRNPNEITFKRAEHLFQDFIHFSFKKLYPIIFSHILNLKTTNPQFFAHNSFVFLAKNWCVVAHQCAGVK